MRITFVVIGALLVIVVAVGVLAVVQPFADDGDDEPARVEVSVDAIVGTPPRWYRAAVEVTARAVPLDAERFLLEDDERAIIVQPEPGALTGEVERGEQVTVAGVVYRLNRLQVDALRPLLQDEGRPVLARAPTDLGAPYISAQDVDALP
ncbi:MAG TPA: hypothetical protein VGR11_16305 [Solirubrobacteraceae bacterium]|nr:hypothetical protein [Solirubrobacteraceae bacterium]